MAITWNKQLETGNAEIDAQHKELIRIANVLLKAVSLGRDERVVNNVIRKLRDYTVFHFSNEEALMEEIHYPARGGHEAEHARLKKEVKAYQRDLYKHQDPTQEEILAFLKGWLLNHILEYDFNLAKYVREKKAKAKSEGRIG